jgi:RimJ/RimL family protein N-acetyltransferase
LESAGNAYSKRLTSWPKNCHLPIGIFDQFGKLVGLIDVLRGYRTASDWYIGLMLLAPAFQAQGFGTEIHNEFVS